MDDRAREHIQKDCDTAMGIVGRLPKKFGVPVLNLISSVEWLIAHVEQRESAIASWKLAYEELDRKYQRLLDEALTKRNG